MQMQLIMDIITLQLRKTVPPISLAILAHTAPQLHINPLAPIQIAQFSVKRKSWTRKRSTLFPMLKYRTSAVVVGSSGVLY